MWRYNDIIPVKITREFVNNVNINVLTDNNQGAIENFETIIEDKTSFTDEGFEYIKEIYSTFVTDLNNITTLSQLKQYVNQIRIIVLNFKINIDDSVFDLDLNNINTLDQYIKQRQITEPVFNINMRDHIANFNPQSHLFSIKKEILFSLLKYIFIYCEYDNADDYKVREGIIGEHDITPWIINDVINDDPMLGNLFKIPIMSHSEEPTFTVNVTINNIITSIDIEYQTLL